jgi:hypothetical protein
MVWKRIVDRVDIRIGQKVLIAPIGFRNAKLIGRVLGTLEAPRGNSSDMSGAGTTLSLG